MHNREVIGWGYRTRRLTMRERFQRNGLSVNRGSGQLKSGIANRFVKLLSR
jgi:hypothetical protein